MQTDKILVRGCNWIGDAVMSLPALSALHHNFPNSHISVMVRPWVADIYKNQPGVQNIISFDNAKGLKGRLNTVKKIREHKFDMALLFPNSFDAALMAYLGGVKSIIGYARDGRRILLNKAVKIAEEDFYIHESFYYLNILKGAGLEAPFSLPGIKASRQSIQEAQKLLGPVNPDEFILAIAPGASFGTAKQWPVKNFAETAALILEKYPGRIIILGAKSEADTSFELTTLLAKYNTRTNKVMNLTGQSDLATAAALLSLSSLLLCNDSGLMHLAGALGLPLVAAFGPTNPLTTAPLGRSRLLRSSAPCSPCLKRECPLGQKICFFGVTPEKMALGAFDLLDTTSGEDGVSAVFLDRDGTINQEVDYLSRPEDMRLIPGAAKAIYKLKEAGLKVIVTTNQSGVARAKFSLQDLERIHERMNNLLIEEGGCVPDAIYFCPHHEHGSVPELAIKCDCRKPASGMFKRAANDFGINLRKSFWVGDRKRDIEASAEFGGLSALVCTGYGLKEAKENTGSFQPSIVAPDLWRASEWICARLVLSKKEAGN